ncbi:MULTISPECIES: hypothetical protein [Kitasatospora]|uniref:hypothetical protein n=1 Tax=Kitasatospora TaxID=2063 RepID=UPI0005270DE7|nr:MULTISPECIES: hypothetical protein [Kitasatospora]
MTPTALLVDIAVLGSTGAALLLGPTASSRGVSGTTTSAPAVSAPAAVAPGAAALPPGPSGPGGRCGPRCCRRR